MVNSKKNLSRVVFASLFGLFIAQNSAYADKDLADSFPDIPTVATADLPPLGDVPTFFVNLDPITMATYLRRDREEGRRHLDKEKPSLLDPYVTKVKSFPVGNSSENGFSQGNPYICVTIINMSIPSWNDPATIPAAYNQPTNASRACSTAGSPTQPMNRNTTNLTNFYNAYNVQVHYNSSYKVQMLMTKSQPSSIANANPEPSQGWGIAFFDTNGSQGRLQEVVWMNANYVMN